ncbi:CPBP family intramembrane glutamic endopeptidase [Cellulomonas sp. McL0617]|uniref:CPBP family intramembrane glutamic endopeptidase n=1 Tax=Cellulomonas sp. McL0617 TaxID=3415675 RepID=UPI003CF49F1F
MTGTLDALQELDLPAVTAVALVAAALALVALEPVTGRRAYRRFLSHLDGDPEHRRAVRVRFYRRWTRQGWILGLAVVALVVVLPGVSLRELGLRLPVLARSPGADSALAILLGAAIGLAVVAIAALVLRRRLPGVRRTPAPAHPMHPVSSADRRGWAWLSLSAGVTEEVTYRGLVVLALATVLRGAAAVVVIVAAGALFGLAHWYQGGLGMLATGALGAVLAGLYLSTGSLVIPMVLHVLIDLAVLARIAVAPTPESVQPA